MDKEGSLVSESSRQSLEEDVEDLKARSDNDGRVENSPKNRTYNFRPTPSRKSRLRAHQTISDGSIDD